MLPWLKRAPRWTPAPLPDTPWRNAQRGWDTPLGIALSQAQWWRTAALGTLVLSMGLSGGMWQQANKVKVVPYYIEVSEAGQVRAIGKIDQAAYEPTVAAIQRELAQFVEEVRGISSDQEVLRRNWEKAWAFLTPQGKEALTQYAKEVAPQKQIGKILVWVEVSMVRRVAERSYDVEWKETVQDRNLPTEKIETRYGGLFHLIIQPPADEHTLKANPLGIYIDVFTWQKKMV